MATTRLAITRLDGRSQAKLGITKLSRQRLSHWYYREVSSHRNTGLGPPERLVTAEVVFTARAGRIESGYRGDRDERLGVGGGRRLGTPDTEFTSKMLDNIDWRQCPSAVLF